MAAAEVPLQRTSSWRLCPSWLLRAVGLGDAVGAQVDPEVLIFEGGGTKGITYAGALKVLEDRGVLKNIKCFAGTSAGSQTAALLAIGYTGKELEAMMLENPFRDLFDGTAGCCGSNILCKSKCGEPCSIVGCCKGLWRLCCKLGVYRGDNLQTYMEKQIRKKRKNGRSECTFRELYEETGNDLRIGVTDVTHRLFTFLDRHSQPDMPVSLAVRASSSVPLLFTPTVYNETMYVDGFLEGNLPMNAFPGKPGIAFHLMAREHAYPGTETINPTSVTGLIKILMDIMMCSAQRKHGMLVNKSSRDLFHATSGRNYFDCVQSGRVEFGNIEVLAINCEDHPLMETRLKREELKAMIALGESAATNFLREKDSAKLC